VASSTFPELDRVTGQQRIPLRAPHWFQQLRWHLLRNSLHLLFARSPLRVLTILGCCLFIWAALFGLSYFGFRELVEVWKIQLDIDLMVLVLNLSFVSLSLLLLSSTGIILYGSLFTAPESAFLLTTPLPAEEIFAFRFQGALGFSSWSFVLLGSPVLLAYGLVVQGGAPWYYFVLLPLYFVGFLLVPGSLGALLSLLLVNFFPRRKKQVLISLVVVLVLVAAWWIYARILPTAQQAGVIRDQISVLVGEFALLQSPLLPPQWMAQGLRDAAVGDLESALYRLTLIWANGLMLYLVTTWIARGLYRRGFDRLASGGGSRRRYGPSWLDRLLGVPFWFLGKSTRVLFEKDFRTFRRDPVQWGQLLIFFGLVVLVFCMMRLLYLQSISANFQNLIGGLFLTATSLLLCAYTGRFVYPMLSLEGRKFWILGLLPLKRSDLIRSKFVYASVMTLGAGELLVLSSHLLLGLAWPFVVLHGVAIAVLAVGLSGLCTGMGATLPNFRETDPSKIAVGFGGTLTLVLGLLFQVGILGSMVVPWHIAVAINENEDIALIATRGWLWVGVGVGIGLGALAVALPLRSGARALEKMEF
jgi:ABC-2 type transport system permease protein